MSYLDVYIGDLEDPHFSWDDKNWAVGNVPKRKSPFFPHPAPFFDLVDGIKEGKFVGKQTDWGGWVAKTTKAQIKEFIKESYAGVEIYERQGPASKHLFDRMQELVLYVESLDDNKQYALVASELQRKRLGRFLNLNHGDAKIRRRSLA